MIGMDGDPMPNGKSAAESGQEKKTHVKHGEFSQNGTEFFVECILRKLDLAHIKIPYATDFEVLVNDLPITWVSLAQKKRN
jgi:hypothetical protein